jgi:class 3 adenylate cyclase
VSIDPAPSPYEARVERSFAFIDLSGFTRFTDVEGDGAAVDVLTHFRSRVREIAARRGVRIAKWLGDGAMLVAVDAEPLTEAIVDMEHAFDSAPLALRAGLSSGPVILFEGDDYIGAAVNLAARLCAKADPGEVIAPASMISSLMVNTEVTPIGAHEIQGFAEPVELVRLDSL